jgi:hypothetical protein
MVPEGLGIKNFNIWTQCNYKTRFGWIYVVIAVDSVIAKLYFFLLWYLLA